MPTVRPRSWLSALALSLLAVSCRPAPDQAATGSADLVLRNGAVYTLVAPAPGGKAPVGPEASAVAVTGGRIAWIGGEDGISGWIGPQTRVVDLQGQMLLPGFIDSHVHLAEGGIELDECALDALETPEAQVAAVRDCAAAKPAAAWVLGNGWQLPVFPGANPHKALLDAVVPDRPVYLSAADGHSAWVNSKALEIAGITGATPDPADGRIERDPDGSPSGTLREAAVDLVWNYLPKPTDEERIAGLRRALAEAARFGITAIQEASLGEPGLRAYAALERANELTLRARAALAVDPEKGPAQVPALVALREKYRRGLLRPEAAKLFADGVIEARTAALLEPYLLPSGAPSQESGTPIWEPAELDAMVAALDRAGFQVHVHAIGDRGVRLTLDALEKARAANGPRDARPHIAHLELIHPHDVARFARLGVVADFQALWAQEDSYIRDLTVPVLGPERSRWIYPLGSVARAGGTIAGGSDWTVTSLNPLEAIQVAVTRRAIDAGPGPAFLPQEAIDLAAVLAAYTRNGAWANFLEQETGTIEPGKAADLIVLDRDLFKIPAEEIHRAKVLLTLLAGREVYRDPGLETPTPGARAAGGRGPS
jgi:predicted amidohydrolase YtcJ